MTRRLLICLVAAASICCAQPAAPQAQHWQVAGLDREALVYAPATAKTTPSPLVFVFHGHGGRMNGTARSFHIQTLWPEAIVVYPQGLPTQGVLTDREGKLPGWQFRPGGQDDRDLKFFDAMLKTLEGEYKIDKSRIYATGHSNGGAFTYLLWAERGDVLAAVAPSGAIAQPAERGQLKPKPVLHIAGKNDPLVKFEWQQQTIDFLKAHNGKEPVETYLYDGGHAFPPDTPERIVAFFRGLPGHPLL